MCSDNIFVMTIEGRVDVHGVPIPFYRVKPKEREKVSLDRPDFDSIAAGETWSPRQITIVDEHHLRLQVGNVKVTSSEPSKFKPVPDGHFTPTEVIPTSFGLSYPPGGVLERDKINQYNIVTRKNWWGKRTTYNWKP